MVIWSIWNSSIDFASDSFAIFFFFASDFFVIFRIFGYFRNLEHFWSRITVSVFFFLFFWAFSKHLSYSLYLWFYAKDWPSQINLLYLWRIPANMHRKSKKLLYLVLYCCILYCCGFFFSKDGFGKETKMVAAQQKANRTLQNNIKHKLVLVRV